MLRHAVAISILQVLVAFPTLGQEISKRADAPNVGTPAAPTLRAVRIDAPGQKPSGPADAGAVPLIDQNQPSQAGEPNGVILSTPTGTSFTYQGQLKVSGVPANTPYDMQFTLTDETGATIAGPICRDNVSCTDGLFTVALDFGAQFSGDARELALAVRPAGGVGDCGVGGGYAPLLPRQKLTAAPYAMGLKLPYQATAAIPGESLISLHQTSVADSCAFFEADGNFGVIGFDNGNTHNGVFGLTALTATDFFWYAPDSGVGGYSDNGQGVAGVTITGTAIYGQNLDAAGYAARFDGRSFLNGNVGIGTSSPSFPLSFADTLGDKISLYGQSGDHYGFGIQSTLLQIYSDQSISDIAFGWGSSSSFHEKMRIKGNGNVGIGTNNPGDTLDVNGTTKMTGFTMPTGAAANKVLTADGLGNGTWQSAANGSLPSGSAVAGAAAPTATTQFLSPTTAVTIAAGQKILVTAHRSFGTTSAAGAATLDLFIGYRLSGSGATPTLVGGGALGNRVPQNTRIPMGLSGIITGLAAGTYDVGLAGDDNGNGQWNSNDWGYVTALAFN